MASGSFTIEQARSIEELTQLAADERLAEALIPSSELLPELPTEVVDRITEAQIRQGRDFRVSPFRNRGEAQHIKVVNQGGELIAVGEAVMPNLYHPAVVL